MSGPLIPRIDKCMRSRTDLPCLLRAVWAQPPSPRLHLEVSFFLAENFGYYETELHQPREAQCQFEASMGLVKDDETFSSIFEDLFALKVEKREGPEGVELHMSPV